MKCLILLCNGNESSKIFYQSLSTWNIIIFKRSYYFYYHWTTFCVSQHIIYSTKEFTKVHPAVKSQTALSAGQSLVSTIEYEKMNLFSNWIEMKWTFPLRIGREQKNKGAAYLDGEIWSNVIEYINSSRTWNLHYCPPSE